MRAWKKIWISFPFRTFNTMDILVTFFIQNTNALNTWETKTTSNTNVNDTTCNFWMRDNMLERQRPHWITTHWTVPSNDPGVWDVFASTLKYRNQETTKTATSLLGNIAQIIFRRICERQKIASFLCKKNTSPKCSTCADFRMPWLAKVHQRGFSWFSKAVLFGKEVVPTREVWQSCLVLAGWFVFGCRSSTAKWLTHLNSKTNNSRWFPREYRTHHK